MLKKENRNVQHLGCILQTPFRKKLESGAENTPTDKTNVAGYMSMSPPTIPKPQCAAVPSARYFTRGGTGYYGPSGTE